MSAPGMFAMAWWRTMERAGWWEDCDNATRPGDWVLAAYDYWRGLSLAGDAS